jgi:hypothetical protein
MSVLRSQVKAGYSAQLTSLRASPASTPDSFASANA